MKSQEVSSDVPSVTVVMSTYNGEKYVRQQIESILSQRDVSVRLLIRDDGSSDCTREIIGEYLGRDEKITLIAGENIGFKSSFIEALRVAPTADYYAFSDQDDVWSPEKLIKTISLMSDVAPEAEPSVAFQNATVVSEELQAKHPLYASDRVIPYRAVTMIEPVAHGFLMVFTAAMRDVAISLQKPDSLPHDMWIGFLASYLGSIYCGNDEVAMYRRLESSLSRKRPLKTFQHRIHSLVKDEGIASACASRILENASCLLGRSARAELENLVEYRTNASAKAALLANPQIRRDGALGKLMLNLKIRFNRF